MWGTNQKQPFSSAYHIVPINNSLGKNKIFITLVTTKIRSASMDSTHLTEEQSKDGQEASQQDCKLFILSLPKENGWGLSQNLYLFQGFWCPSNLIEPIISFQNNFQAKDNDIIVASLPKSGTTWLKHLHLQLLIVVPFPP